MLMRVTRCTSISTYAPQRRALIGSVSVVQVLQVTSAVGVLRQRAGGQFLVVGHRATGATSPLVFGARVGTLLLAPERKQPAGLLKRARIMDDDARKVGHFLGWNSLCSVQLLNDLAKFYLKTKDTSCKLHLRILIA